MIAKNSVRKKNNDNFYNNFAGYVFLSPILAGFIVFMAFPLGFSFVLSFAQWDFMKGFSAIRFVGFQNFIAIFKDAWFIDSMKNTLIFTCITVLVSVSMTEGGPGTSTTVIAYYIYRSAFRYYELEKASASAWVMFLCISAITIFQWKYQKKWDSHN